MMKDYAVKLFSVLAVVAAHAFCRVDGLVPTQQNWKRNLPTRGLVPYQPNVYFSQQQRSSPFARAASTYGASIPTYTSPQSAGTIQDLLLFTNEERRRQGLGELRYNKELERAAQRHAGDMAKNNYFSHDGLDGSDLKDRVGSTEYRYTNVGENLFWRTPDNDPAYAVQGWMESMSHRKNMLDPQFTEIGLGYAVDPTNAKHYYVQVFGRPLNTPNVGASAQDTRESMIHATNEARQRQGLPPFDISPELTQGAQEHAEDMMRSGQLTSKLKRGSYDRFFTNVGARFAAREIFNDPHGAVQGWLEKGPQSDILSERFTETGIGYATDGEQHYYVQFFGTPMETGVGRRDSTRAGAAPPRTPLRAPPMGAPQPEKKEDKARNGDFGRQGFGRSNRERRQDADDIDDQWMDDKKVLEALQNRPGQRPVRRSNNNNSQNNMGRQNINYDDMGRQNNNYDDGGLKPLGSDGFDDWNRDYAGTANRRDYQMGTHGAMLARRSRGMMPGGGGAGPMPLRSQQDMMNPSGPRYQFDRPNPFDRRTNSNNGYAANDYGREGPPGYLDRSQQRTNSNGRDGPPGYRDRTSQQQRMNSNNGRGDGYPDPRNQQRTNSNGRQIRRPTPTAFAGQTSRKDPQNNGFKDSVNDIHFQRHQLEQMGKMGGGMGNMGGGMGNMGGGMGGMGMEEEMMFGPGPPGMRGQGRMYGGNQMSGPAGMFRGNQMMRDPGMAGMYGRNQMMREPGMAGMSGMYGRNQMRDPSAYGRYDFGQPPQQRVGPPNDYMRGPSNLGMGGGSEFGRGEYFAGQYSNRMMDGGMNGGYGTMRGGRAGVRPDEFGP